MNRRATLAAVSGSLLIAAVAIPGAFAQSAKSLVGTYTPVSVKTFDASGKSSDIFGANPRGLLVFTADGRYSLMLSRASLPKFASNSRLKGTPEENQAIIAGTIAHFGKYSVNEKDKTVTFNVETSTFPNWEGGAQTRPFTVKGDEFTYKVAAVSGGTGAGEVVWKRVK